MRPVRSCGLVPKRGHAADAFEPVQLPQIAQGHPQIAKHSDVVRFVPAQMLQGSHRPDEVAGLFLSVDDIQWIGPSRVGLPSDLDRLLVDDDLDPAAKFGVFSFQGSTDFRFELVRPRRLCMGGNSDLSKS